ncbi:MAG: uracil-DNA glycosylase [Nitrosomonadales bacterium]|nr:uracil-DNA glycosylase [Nitrosomonadales bacterium]
MNTVITTPVFDIECRLCPRLAGFLDKVRIQQPDYFARPVPSFGDEHPKLLVVGLAPGMHGANRTGRPFTGDYAGVLLYQTLYKFGYASADISVSAEDGLRLQGCRITNAVKCLPPENKPTGDEIKICNRYLAAEFASLPSDLVILALGNIAHQAVLKAQGVKVGAYKFGHAARHVLPSGQVLYDSYHCSRYNTQTRRLTEAMFHEVFASINQELRR